VLVTVFQAFYILDALYMEPAIMTTMDVIMDHIGQVQDCPPKQAWPHLHKHLDINGARCLTDKCEASRTIDIKVFMEMRPGLLGWTILNLSNVAHQYLEDGDQHDRVSDVAIGSVLVGHIGQVQDCPPKQVSRCLWR
jgi:hypothetical protein